MHQIHKHFVYIPIKKTMFEKVNPYHPDKVADRIAGALVDIAYKHDDNPRIAVEVLIGHGWVTVIVETSLRRGELNTQDVVKVINRLAPEVKENNIYILIVPQDAHLSVNQRNGVRCGDNGIFCGYPVTAEQEALTSFAKKVTREFPYDGKYIIDTLDDGYGMTVCQSNAIYSDMKRIIPDDVISCQINPLGYWTGGTGVDSGATNRKLGSDMGDAVTGGGLHGKDLSKADVSVNIVCHLMAEERSCGVEASCAIGDESITFYDIYGEELEKMEYSAVVEKARAYIKDIGGFERFAEWGLIR